MTLYPISPQELAYVAPLVPECETRGQEAEFLPKVRTAGLAPDSKLG